MYKYIIYVEQVKKGKEKGKETNLLTYVTYETYSYLTSNLTS